MFFVGDGISGTTFDRPDFQSMEHMKKTSEIGTVVIKDLSRFVREHILFDHCTQMIYSSLGVNFISIQEIVETISGKGTEILQYVVGQTRFQYFERWNSVEMLFKWSAKVN